KTLQVVPPRRYSQLLQHAHPCPFPSFTDVNLRGSDGLFSQLSQGVGQLLIPEKPGDNNEDADETTNDEPEHQSKEETPSTQANDSSEKGKEDELGKSEEAYQSKLLDDSDNDNDSDNEEQKRQRHIRERLADTTWETDSEEDDKIN